MPLFKAKTRLKSVNTAKKTTLFNPFETLCPDIPRIRKPRKNAKTPRFSAGFPFNSVILSPVRAKDPEQRFLSGLDSSRHSPLRMTSMKNPRSFPRDFLLNDFLRHPERRAKPVVKDPGQLRHSEPCRGEESRMSGLGPSSLRSSG